MKWLASVVLLSAGLTVAGCSEASFNLASESRLPRWFATPRGLSRPMVSVTLSVDFGARTVTVRMWGANHQQLDEVSATVRDNEPLSLSKVKSEDGLPQYPVYEVLTSHGITEVAEFREMSAVFHMSDDPAVHKALGVP